MNPVDRDTFAHALGQTMEFYGKTLDRAQLSFWITACADTPIDALKSALLKYTKEGRYAPKPVDILDLCKALPASHRPLPKPEIKPCPPEIRDAWRWFINRIAKGSNLDGLFSSDQDIDLETQERYLHTVNREAAAAKEPDAIPDEHKLQEYWR